MTRRDRHTATPQCLECGVITELHRDSGRQHAVEIPVIATEPVDLLSDPFRDRHLFHSVKEFPTIHHALRH